MTTTLVKGTVLGGLALFLWGAVSWMVLPWHQATLLPFANTMLETADRIIGWFFAGVVIAKFCA